MTEEEAFCVLWCYMLDQNYAWKYGSSQRVFDPEPGLIDQSLRGTTSDLLTIYVIMAQVQDATLSSSRFPHSTESRSTHRTLCQSTEQLLAKMEEVERRIQEVVVSFLLPYSIHIPRP